MPVFLFTDIESSTQLWEKHRQMMPDVLRRHDLILTEELKRHDGRVLDHLGDGVYAVFPIGKQALACTVAMQLRLFETDWGEVGDIRVRMGLDARPKEKEGDDYFTDDSGDYFGPVVNQTSRIMSAGWGGQILITPQVLELSRLPAGASIEDLGTHTLKHIPQPQKIYRLVHPELPAYEFPPLRSPSYQPYDLLLQLTAGEIEAGLNRLEALLPVRAPVLMDRFHYQAELLREAMTITVQQELLRSSVEERREALLAINKLCEELLERNFRAVSLEQPIPDYDGRCPFRGLAPFRATDSQFFFGRQDLVSRMVRRLSQYPFLAILGASGSGKSSLLLAGLLPQLQQEQPNLQIARMTPGQEPAAQLTAVLSQCHPDQPYMLVVDQFEEIFTQTTDVQQRLHFIEKLLSLLPDRKVVLAMRADFWGECALFPALKEPMQAHQELVGPLTKFELRRAMEQQAAAVGLQFEPGLSYTILNDVAGEPGAMPLLQHTLLELWHRRHGPWLRTEEYQHIGGVQRAIAVTADKLYKRLDAPLQLYMKEIFIRLTRLDTNSNGDDYRDTRQRVQLVELAPAGADIKEIQNLIQRLADVRLVVTSINNTTGNKEVEVIHEALIRYWLRLRRWLNENRQLLQRRDTIRRAAHGWLQADENDRENLLLHRGSRLEEVERLVQTKQLSLNKQEQAYINACIALRQRQEAAQKARQQRELAQAQQLAEIQQQRLEEQTRAAQRLRRRSLYLAVALILALITSITSVFFYTQARARADEAQLNADLAVTREYESKANADLAFTRQAEAELNAYLAATRQAESELNAALAEARQTEAETSAVMAATQEREAQLSQEEAELQAQIALSRQLAAQSAIELNRPNYELALLLAIEANRVAGTDEALAAMRQALAQPGSLQQIYAHEDIVTKGIWSKDEKLILTSSLDGQVKLWEVATGRSLLAITHPAPVTTVLWNSDESQILTADTNGVIYLWDAAGNSLLQITDGHEDAVVTLQWNRDESRILSTSADGTARIWDAQNGSERLRLSHTAAVNTAGWNQDESRILTAAEDGQAIIWDAVSGEKEIVFENGGQVKQASWSPDEEQVLTASWLPDQATVWDAVTGEIVLALPDSSGVNEARWDASGQRILTGGQGGNAYIWDAEDGEPLLKMRHENWVLHVEWSHDNSQILSTGQDGLTRVWEVETGTQVVALRHEKPVTEASWNRDEMRILTIGLDGTARIWNATVGAEVAAAQHEVGVWQISWSKDESRFLTASFDGTAAVWDSVTGAKLITMTHDSTVLFAAWNNDDSQIITASDDGTAVIWDAASGARLQTFEDEAGLWQAALNGDESRLVTAGSSGVVKIWSVTTGELLNQFETGSLTFQALWSQDEQRLLSADLEAARVWDVQSGAELLTLEHEALVRAAQWNRDESLILTNSWDGTAAVWRAATGEKILSLKHDGAVRQAIWNAAETQILTASDDGTVVVWDAVSGERQFVLPHDEQVNLAYWNQAETKIVTAGTDGQARIWDVASHEVMVRLGHTLEIYDLAWSDDERYILTGSQDDTARIFFVYAEDVLAAACARSTRNMTRTEWQRFLPDRAYRPTCPNLPAE